MDITSLLASVALSLKALRFIALDLQKREFIKGEDLTELIAALGSVQTLVDAITKTIETATLECKQTYSDYLEYLKKQKDPKKYDA